MVETPDTWKVETFTGLGGEGGQSHTVVTKALGDGVWSLEKSKKQEKEAWRGRKTEKGRLEE